VPLSAAGIPTKDSRAKFPPQAKNTNAFEKSGNSRALEHNMRPKGRPILNYPLPDYTKVKPKTNTYNRPKTGSQNIQVSSVVTYKLARYRLEDLIQFVHDGFVTCSILIL
jgi:hypothetical protein